MIPGTRVKSAEGKFGLLVKCHSAPKGVIAEVRLDGDVGTTMHNMHELDAADAVPAQQEPAADEATGPEAATLEATGPEAAPAEPAADAKPARRRKKQS